MFSNNNVTNRGFLALPKLRYLDIECCDNVSEDMNDLLADQRKRAKRA